MLRTTTRRLCLIVLGLCTAGLAPADPYVAPHDGHHPPSATSHPTAEATADARRAYLSARIAADPTDALSLSLLAKESLQQAKRSGTHEHYEAAELAFRQWLAQDASNTSASLGLGYALLGQHRFREALQFARRAALEAPKEPQIWALLGDLHFALGNYVEAEFAYRALESDGLNLFTLARLAQIHQHGGRVDQARKLYAEALEAGRLLEEPASALAWVHTMIGALDLEAGQLIDAEANFNSALSLDPTMHAARYAIAQVEVAEGHLDHALPTLRELVKTNALPRYRLLLGKVQGGSEGQARLDQVERELEAEVAAGEVGHVRELAELYMFRGKQLEKALELAQIDLDRVRQDANAYETLAWAHHQLGHGPAALEHVRRALLPGPSSVRLLLRAAAISAANGMEREASELIELACQRDALLAQELLSQSAAGLYGPHARWVLNHLD